MTSFIRSYVAPKEGITRFLSPESPCYNEDGIIRLFPFVYSNGVLDVTYEGNTFKAQMVDITGNSPDSETDTSIRILGVPHVATAIGENFKDYIRAWRDGSIDAGSPIEVYAPFQIIRVQECTYDKVNADGDSYQITTTAPVSDNYIDGSASNSYYSTYIFRTPLTVSIVEGGIKKYITFRSVMDQE
jgi:hypothetical protein